MSKRPSLFAPKQESSDATRDVAASTPTTLASAEGSIAKRPPSRAGKRVLSTYLDPLAWKQMRQLALDLDTSTQALGEEAVNLLFAKHGINRSA